MPADNEACFFCRYCQTQIMEEQRNKHQTGQDGGIGRTHNQGAPENEGEQKGSDKADISSMDQQEGSMHHGETGGSGHLDPKREENKKEQ